MTHELLLPRNIDTNMYLAAIITSSDDAIVSKDLNGNITSWNPAAARIFGYTSEEIIGKHISILIPSENVGEEDYILGKIKAGERIDHFETMRRKKDGSLVSLSVTISPIRNSEGQIIGASKVARDITLLKNADQTSAYLAAIIESSDDAIISKDLNGFITSWNNSAERIFGYKAEEAIGHHVTLIIPSERIKEEDTILTTLRTGNRVDHFETWRRHKDGHLIPVSLTVSPIRDLAGNVIGASKVSRDITDQIAAQKAVHESNQKKNEFLANISHELRTPMNAVIGLTDLLKRIEELPERAKKYVHTLSISAEHMMDLINDLLDLAKVEAGAFVIENVKFNLIDQIEKIINVSSIRAKAKKIDLSLTYSDELNHYYISDPLRIQQILSNLVSNAIKFTDNGSVSVKINGKINEDSNTTSITFQVSDTGIGIQPNKLQMIFDKFTQADSSITRRFGGSGLGLAIVKTCVEMMGGSIAVDSQVDVGTVFTVILPLENCLQDPAVEKYLPAESSQLVAHKKSVLLVEDYEPNILVASSFLDELGHEYEVARNGFDALRKFMNGRYDIILMDIQMSQLDGLEATRHIREMEKKMNLARTPIIAMTAHVREQDKEQALRVGMDDFIAKPFELSTLIKKLGRFS